MTVEVHIHALPGSRTLVRDYIPETRSAGIPLLWVHGGGFAGGSIDMPESDAVARNLAAQGRFIRTVDYRLAPALSESGPLRPEPAAHRYPAAQNDVIQAFFDLDANGAVFLGGASAGACIAASVAVRVRDERRPRPRGLVLAYGLFHASFPEHHDAEGRRLRELTDATADTWLTRMALNYAGTEDLLANAQVFPGSAMPIGLPETLIMDAEHDTLRASGKRFAAQLRDAGVETTEVIVHRSGHGFLNRPEDPYFARGIAQMREWMNRRDHPSL